MALLKWSRSLPVGGYRHVWLTVVHVGCVTGELCLAFFITGSSLVLIWRQRVFLSSCLHDLLVSKTSGHFRSRLLDFYAQLMQWNVFLIDVSTTDFKEKETAVKQWNVFFRRIHLVSNKSLKKKFRLLGASSLISTSISHIYACETRLKPVALHKLLLLYGRECSDHQGCSSLVNRNNLFNSPCAGIWGVINPGYCGEQLTKY